MIFTSYLQVSNVSASPFWVAIFIPGPTMVPASLETTRSNGVSLIFAGHVHQLRLDRVKDVSLAEE